MKKILLSITFSIAIIFSNAQTPSFKWAGKIGGLSDEEALSMTVDAAGNVYTTGYFKGAVDFDPGLGVNNLISEGGTDMYVSKLNSLGNYVWSRQIGDTVDDMGISVTLDGSSNVCITGTFSGTVDMDPGGGVFNLTSSGLTDIFILKLDPQGNFLWAKRIGNALADASRFILSDINDNIFVGGTFTSTVDFDPGSSTVNLTSAGALDMFILKLDDAGNFAWVKSIGGTSAVDVTSATLDASGNIYTAGKLKGSADFDPGAGTATLTSMGVDDIFISKLNSSGGYIWAKSIGGTLTDYANAICVDGSGNVYTTGRFTGLVDFDPGAGTSNLTAIGSYDIFITKLGSTGSLVYAKSIGSTGNDEGRGIAADATGNVYATGIFTGTADFDPGLTTMSLTSLGASDAYIIKFDGGGNFRWAGNFAGTQNDISNAISVDAFNNVYTTGYFMGTGDFDPGTAVSNLTAYGGQDIFVQKIGQDAGGIKNDNSAINFQCYPNPSNGLVNIIIPDYSSNMQIEITNCIGETVLKLDHISENNIADISAYANGLYFIRIVSENKIISEGKMLKN